MEWVFLRLIETMIRPLWIVQQSKEELGGIRRLAYTQTLMDYILLVLILRQEMESNGPRGINPNTH